MRMVKKKMAVLEKVWTPKMLPEKISIMKPDKKARIAPARGLVLSPK